MWCYNPSTCNRLRFYIGFFLLLLMHASMEGFTSLNCPELFRTGTVTRIIHFYAISQTTMYSDSEKLFMKLVNLQKMCLISFGIQDRWRKFKHIYILTHTVCKFLSRIELFPGIYIEYIQFFYYRKWYFFLSIFFFHERPSQNLRSNLDSLMIGLKFGKWW